jgi:hypothetical protein
MGVRVRRMAKLLRFPVTRRSVRVFLRSDVMRSGSYRRSGRLWLHDTESVPAWMPTKKAFGPDPHPPAVGEGFGSSMGPCAHLVNRSGGTSGASIFLDRGNLFLAVAPSSGWMIRWISSPIRADFYAMVRSEAQRCISSPWFAVEQAGHAIRDGWVKDAIPALRLSPQERLGHVRRLLDELEALVAAGSPTRAGVTTQMFTEELLRAIPHRRLDVGLRSVLASEEFLRAASGGKLVPSHGDLGAHNFLVSDGRHVVVDWEPKNVGIRPFWCDVSRVLTSDPEALRSGVFDAHIERIWRAAGLSADGVLANRDHLAAFGAVERLSRRTTVELGPSSRPVVGLSISGQPVRSITRSIGRVQVQRANSVWRTNNDRPASLE